VAPWQQSTFVAVGLSLAIVLPAADGAAAPSTATLETADIVSRLRGDEPLRLEGARIRNLDLRTLQVVRPLFQCRDCRIVGSLVAADVRFEHAVDLSGIKVGGTTDFHGATFAAPVLFGAEFARASGATFSGDVDFSLATFDDLVSFNGANFQHGATFALTRFRSDTVFANTTFDRRASFTAAVFGGATRFDQADFTDGAELDRASFRGRADLRRSEYGGAASFAEADFAHGADFSESTFDRPATFTRARFAEGASFAGVRFSGEKSPDAATFERVVSRGRLNFTDATFGRDVDFRDVTADAVSFDHASIPSRASLFMRSLAADDLVLSVDATDRVDAGSREPIVDLIESSAKTRGDIGLANDAHYRLQMLASRDDSLPQRIADTIFYRGIAGYFVRPLRPVLVLLVLAVAFAVWRQLEWGRGVAGRSAWRRPSLPEAERVPMRVFDSLASIGRGGADAGASAARRLEILTYRVLIVCALIGLANSNPTLRQMFDALL
jgi:Pentapeptide repeats (9 copies)